MAATGFIFRNTHALFSLSIWISGYAPDKHPESVKRDDDLYDTPVSLNLRSITFCSLLAT